MNNGPEGTNRSKPRAKSRTMTGGGWYSPKDPAKPDERPGPPEEIGGYVTLGMPDYLKLAGRELNGEISLLDQKLNFFQNPSIAKAIKARASIVLAAYDPEEKLTLTNVPVKLYALSFNPDKGTFGFKSVRDMVESPSFVPEFITPSTPVAETPSVRKWITATMVAAVLGATAGFAIGKGCDNGPTVRNSTITSGDTPSE